MKIAKSKCCDSDFSFRVNKKEMALQKRTIRKDPSIELMVPCAFFCRKCHKECAIEISSIKGVVEKCI